MVRSIYNRITYSAVAVFMGVSLLAAAFIAPRTVSAAWGGPVCAPDATTPIAVMSVDDATVLVPATVRFDSFWSTGCGEPIETVAWDFGDGQSTVGAQATHDYAAGVYTATLTVTDTSGDASTATRQILVKDANTAPVGEDVVFDTTRASWFSFSMAGRYSDPDGDLVYVTAMQVTSGNATVSNYGSDTYYLSGINSTIKNQTITLTYKVNDLFGGVSIASVTVNMQNRAPVAENFTLSTSEDVTASFFLGQHTNDQDYDVLTHSISAQPAHGTVMLSGADGNYTYRPNPNFNGTDSFTYSVTDGDKSASGTVELQVASVNDRIVAPAQTLTTQEDNAVTFNPLAGAIDVDGDTIAFVSVDTPASGSVTANSDGTLTFTPAPQSSGTVSVWYTLTDGTETVRSYANIVVEPVNDTPVISDVALSSVSNNRTASFRAAATDVEQEPLTYSWNYGDGTPTYSSLAGYASHRYARKGTYTVTVTVTDASGAADVATITVKV